MLESESWDADTHNDSMTDPQVLDDTFTPLVDSAERTEIFGGIEDNGCTMPDGFGYEACATGYTFQDISGHSNAHLILKTDTDDDAEVLLRRQVLGGFQFPFYSRVYDQIVIGGNGQITFEWERVSGSVRNNSPINTDLTTGPNVAVIAPFWDDLEIAGDNAAVYWEVLDGANRQDDDSIRRDAILGRSPQYRHDHLPNDPFGDGWLRSWSTMRI